MIGTALHFGTKDTIWLSCNGPTGVLEPVQVGHNTEASVQKLADALEVTNLFLLLMSALDTSADRMCLTIVCFAIAKQLQRCNCMHASLPSQSATSLGHAACC